MRKALEMMDLERASKMWMAGMTQVSIASFFKKTEGQIAGLFSRNRDKFPKRGDIGREKDRLPVPKPEPVVFLDPKEYDKSRLPYAVTLADLDVKRCCHWPVTDHPKGIPNLMCAEVKTSKRYCKAHEQRAWRVK